MAVFFAFINDTVHSLQTNSDVIDYGYGNILVYTTLYSEACLGVLLDKFVPRKQNRELALNIKKKMVQ